jgi:hypothetical protein
MFDLLCSLRDGGPWGIAAAGHADAHSLFEMHIHTQMHDPAASDQKSLLLLVLSRSW